MNKLTRLLALCLAVLLALSAVAMGEEGAVESPAASEAPAVENPVVFTFDGQEITKALVDETMLNLYHNGYITSQTDYDTTIEYMVEEMVLKAEIQGQGLDQFSADEEAAFLADAQAEWDAAVESYVSYYLTEDTEEARASTVQAANDYYMAQGFSVEMLAENYRMSAAYDKLQEKALAGKETQPTEEEIVAVFEEYAEMDKETYEGNFATYEMYQNYGYESWYKPEGFRGILHILLDVDQALLDAYEDAQASYEETLSMEEAPAADGEATEPAVTKADVDAALQAVLDSQKEAIEDIYARLEAGESFETLIAQYNTDPGMMNEENLKNGYEVHADSTMTWIPEFVAGAFSDKMQNPGDWSDPVVASYGIHILYYLRDIPGGYVEITDSIRSQITEYLVSVKTNDILMAAIAEWTAAHEVIYNQDTIDALKGVAE